MLARAIGARRPPGSDRRRLASTRQDLAAAVAAGSFRADLYYRLAVVTLSVPPLRDRPEDIEPLARLFLEETARRLGRDLIFAGSVFDRLRRHAFPGNVRELRHAVERAAVLCDDGRLNPEDFVFDSPAGGSPGHGVTRERLARALAESGGNRVRAAKALGISRATLYRILGDGRNDAPDR
jgi:DNA-binding NtrC family response regulator